MKTLKSTLVTRLCYLLFVFLTVILISINCGEQLDGSTPEQLETSSHEEHDEEGVIHLNKEALSNIVIETVSPEYKSLNYSVKAPGEVLANQNHEALVGTLIGGKVREVFKNQGDFVNKGDVLLTIESLEIGEIKGNYLQSKSELELTETNYLRLDKLFSQNVSSLKSVLEAKAAFEKARAMLAVTEMLVNSIGLSVNEIEKEHSGYGTVNAVLSIKSPASGTIIERNVITGQNIDPSVELMHIMDLSEVWLDANIYEKDLALIDDGGEIVLSVAAWPETVFKGSILFVNKVLDPETRTVKVRSSIKNTDGKLLPEMYGDVKIITNLSFEALIVPSEAVLQDEDHYFVFISGDEPGEFQKVDVKKGRTIDNLTEIIEGLSVNVKVVTKGAFTLKAELLKESFGGHVH